MYVYTMFWLKRQFFIRPLVVFGACDKCVGHYRANEQQLLSIREASTNVSPLLPGAASTHHPRRSTINPGRFSFGRRLLRGGGAHGAPIARYWRLGRRSMAGSLVAQKTSPLLPPPSPPPPPPPRFPCLGGSPGRSLGALQRGDKSRPLSLFGLAERTKTLRR